MNLASAKRSGNTNEAQKQADLVQSWAEVGDRIDKEELPKMQRKMRQWHGKMHRTKRMPSNRFTKSRLLQSSNTLD